MSVRKLAWVLVLTLPVLACQSSSEPTPVAQAYLFEKGPYQAVYGPDGRILRLLYDENGDRVADVVTLFGRNLKPSLVETDSDHDGAIDRWEFYGPKGEIEKIARARAKPAVPDVWEYFGADGSLARQELDEDGDGKVDRIEYFAGGALVRVDLDTDRDGRIDRWQDWAGGKLLDETIDTDGDGTADRRLLYQPSGDVLRIDKLG